METRVRLRARLGGPRPLDQPGDRHDLAPRAPFATHPAAHVWGSRSHDPSFPSDHASAAFGIAFALFFYDRLAGSIFLAAATFIGVGRVFIGAHYPADVVAGCLVGLGV